MRRARFIPHCIALAAFTAVGAPAALAFEGRITAVVIQGTETTPLLYTVGTGFMRIEVTATDGPHPVTIVDIKSGAVTLLFPHNRSFVRLKPETEASAMPAPFPPAPPFPPGIGPPPQGAAGVSPGSTSGSPPIPIPPGILPPGTGQQPKAAPGAPAMPAMPPIRMPPAGNAELKATGETTDILGFACTRYEIKGRGETLEVWATEKLLPFQPYRQDQPHRFTPRGIEERWPGLLTSRKLFPLRASLRHDNGVERFRFEVKSITPQELTAEDARLFEPPSGWFEIEPLASDLGEGVRLS